MYLLILSPVRLCACVYVRARVHAPSSSDSLSCDVFLTGTGPALLPSLLMCVPVWWGQNSPLNAPPLHSHQHHPHQRTNTHIVSQHCIKYYTWLIRVLCDATALFNPTRPFFSISTKEEHYKFMKWCGCTHSHYFCPSPTISLLIEVREWCNVYEDTFIISVL